MTTTLPWVSCKRDSAETQHALDHVGRDEPTAEISLILAKQHPCGRAPRSARSSVHALQDVLEEGVVGAALGGVPRSCGPVSLSHAERFHCLIEYGGLASTKSNVRRRSPSEKAARRACCRWRCESPRRRAARGFIARWRGDVDELLPIETCRARVAARRFTSARQEMSMPPVRRWDRRCSRRPAAPASAP